MQSGAFHPPHSLSRFGPAPATIAVFDAHSRIFGRCPIDQIIESFPARDDKLSINQAHPALPYFFAHILTIEILALALALGVHPQAHPASAPRHFFSRHLRVLGHFGQYLHNEEQIQNSEFRIPSLVSNERILLQHSEQEQDSEQEQEHTKRVRQLRMSPLY